MQNSKARVLGGVAVTLWGIASVPSVAADRVCFTTIDGLLRCSERIPYGARIAICLGAITLVSVVLSLSLCLCMRSRRSRQQDVIAAVYQVDPAQIQGPPTTYVTSFDPRSPAAYPHTPEPASSVPGTAKSTQFPATQQRYAGKYGVKPPQTAPVNQMYGTGSYPFPGYSPKLVPTQQPHTAFSGGFPRPMFTGQLVQKDDVREVHKDIV